MAIELDRAGRLAAMAIDDATIAVLREIRPLMAQHMDGALDAAFDRFMKTPEVAKLYTPASLAEAKRAQRKHWLDGVLAAAFSDEHLAQGIEMGRKRQRMGFSLRWYFLFFTTVLDTLAAAVIFAFRKNPERQARAVSALTRVVQFDLEIFTLGYQDAAETRAADLVGQSAGEFEQAARGMLAEETSAAGLLERTAQALTAAARQASDQASAAKSVFDEASHNIETAAAATEQLSASIHEIGRQVNQSTEIAGSAVDEAQRTNVMVQGLADKARKIGDVVKLINDIASQTNLLALNATIEAARAGDAGKGFAVVAGEVKSLANQTAKATDEISGQIAAVQGATKDAVGAIQGIANTIGRISEITSAIAAAVEEQGAATHEIARHVQQAARSGASLTGNISSVSAATGNIDHAVGDVMGAAGDLSRRAERLGDRIKEFLGKIRSLY
jgi:methyl-accepting chemotaxis protein